MGLGATVREPLRRRRGRRRVTCGLSAVVFLDDADQGGELWFPDLNIAVPPKAGTLVIYANVKRDDYLAPEPRTRHAHRALADDASDHVHAVWKSNLRRVPRHRREMT